MNAPALRVATTTASNAEHIQQVFAIRAAVFMSEQNCPYEEEFDGNDYCATHVIGFVEERPAAVIRVRYFAGFAKLERLAVLKPYRGTPVTRAIVEAALEICRRKGNERVYGHSQARLVGFWEKFGFRPMARNFPRAFSDHAYVESSVSWRAMTTPSRCRAIPISSSGPKARGTRPAFSNNPARGP